MAPLHRPRDQGTSQFPRLHRRDRFLEEDPNVAASSRAWPLQRRGDGHLVANLQYGGNVVPPPSLVKIRREEPAGLVDQQWVDAHDVPTSQVITDNGVADEDVLVYAIVCHAYPPGAAPWIVAVGRREPALAIPTLPTHREHILSSTEERSVEPDLVGVRGGATCTLFS